MSRKKVLAVIPARGGSKRIPRKNIVSFAGSPLIEWTIKAALNAGGFDRVIVSTDDEEIAAVSLAAGAEVPFLRQLAADDYTPVSDATIATVEQCEQHFGEQYLEVVQLFAVCPLRTADQINAALKSFRESRADFLISAFKYQLSNPWWACTIDRNSRPTRVFEDSYIRSQDLPDLYCPTGAIWIAGVEALKLAGSFYGPGHVFWPMPWQAAVDIDTWEDLRLAEALMGVS
jgi:CMP-N-acetylneuraminic acid synthetase